MENVIFERTIDNILLPERKKYRKFLLCLDGSCDIYSNDHKTRLTKGNCAIVISRFTSRIDPSDTFKCEVISIEEAFLRQSEPNNPYIIQGTLSLYQNPVLSLVPEEQQLCRLLFHNFELRLEAKGHKFYDEMLRTSARMLVLDLFDMHSRNYKNDTMSQSSANIMTQFITMLCNKEYRENREVAYYAKQLDVVPKYLSEISNRTSGFSASYWINRFASFEIYQLIVEKKMKGSEIAKMFHFTSTSYFNRYVKRFLGAYPTELRIY